MPKQARRAVVWCAMLILRGNLTSKVGGTLVIFFESHFYHYDLMELASLVHHESMEHALAATGVCVC